MVVVGLDFARTYPIDQSLVDVCGGSIEHECMLPTNHLNLGHCRPTSSDPTQARRRAATPRRQPREDQASQKRGEAEPEERGHRLRFLTSFRVVA